MLLQVHCLLPESFYSRVQLVQNTDEPAGRGIDDESAKKQEESTNRVRVGMELEVGLWASRMYC